MCSDDHNIGKKNEFRLPNDISVYISPHESSVIFLHAYEKLKKVQPWLSYEYFAYLYGVEKSTYQVHTFTSPMYVPISDSWQQFYCQNEKGEMRDENKIHPDIPTKVVKLEVMENEQQLCVDMQSITYQLDTTVRSITYQMDTTVPLMAGPTSELLHQICDRDEKREMHDENWAYPSNPTKVVKFEVIENEQQSCVDLRSNTYQVDFTVPLMAGPTPELQQQVCYRDERGEMHDENVAYSAIPTKVAGFVVMENEQQSCDDMQTNTCQLDTNLPLMVGPTTELQQQICYRDERGEMHDANVPYPDIPTKVVKFEVMENEQQSCGGMLSNTYQLDTNPPLMVDPTTEVQQQICYRDERGVMHAESVAYPNIPTKVCKIEVMEDAQQSHNSTNYSTYQSDTTASHMFVPTSESQQQFCYQDEKGEKRYGNMINVNTLTADPQQMHYDGKDQSIAVTESVNDVINNISATFGRADMHISTDGCTSNEICGSITEYMEKQINTLDDK